MSEELSKWKDYQREHYSQPVIAAHKTVMGLNNRIQDYQKYLDSYTDQINEPLSFNNEELAVKYKNEIQKEIDKYQIELEKSKDQLRMANIELERQLDIYNKNYLADLGEPHLLHYWER